MSKLFFFILYLMKKITIFITFTIITISSFAQLTKKPYLIFTNDIKTMKVVFQAKKPQVYIVNYGQTKEYEIGGAKVSQQKKGKNENIFSYTFKYLKPNTKYYYKITDKHHKEQYFGSFYSAKQESDKKVYFSVMGNNNGINDLSKAIFNFNKTAKKPSAFVLHTGNFIKKGNNEKCWQNTLSNNNTVNSLLANIPIILTKGKNEAKKCLFAKDKQLFKKYLQYKYQSEKGSYYTFMQGNITFIVLDQSSDLSLNSEQYNWLKNNLTSNKKTPKVILMHTFLTQNKSANTKLNELFEKNNVKIVFTSDAKGYLHSKIGNVNYFSLGKKNNLKQKNEKIKIIKSLEGNYFINVKYETNNVLISVLNLNLNVVDKFEFN